MVRKLRSLCAVFASCAALSSVAAQDMPAGYVCAKNAETSEFSQKLPALYDNFRLMASLPLSGRTLHETLTNPAHNLSTCMSPPQNNSGGFSIEQKAAIVGRDSVRSTTPLHESFHAGQYVRGAMGYVSGGSPLTLKDNIATDLLIEATAAAYPFLTEKEALHAGLEHPQPYIPLADRARIRALFDTAFEQELKKTGAVGKALEAGGKAVVRALLEGSEPRWINFYLAQAFSNTGRHPSAKDSSAADYLKNRQEIFSGAGRVSERINITPDELLGQEADAYIKGFLEKQRYKVSLTYPRQKTRAAT